MADKASAGLEAAQDKARTQAMELMEKSIIFNSDMSAIQTHGNNGQRAAKSVPNG